MVVVRTKYVAAGVVFGEAVQAYEVMGIRKVDKVSDICEHLQSTINQHNQPTISSEIAKSIQFEPFLDAEIGAIISFKPNFFSGLGCENNRTL